MPFESVEEDEEETTSQSVLFREHKQALEWIDTLAGGETTAEEQRKSALASLRRTYDKYLECPTLLDPHLEGMVTRLSKSARECLSTSSPKLRFLLSALYALAKVRGRKRIQQFLPHQVRDVEPVVSALQEMSQHLEMLQDDNPPEWESIYVLWIWLGMLSLVPFSSSVMDSSLVPTVVSLAKDHLGQAGPIRETAAACLASWLARPDLEQSELPNFVQWSKTVLDNYRKGTSADIFTTMGVVQTLATVLKVGQRTDTLVTQMETLWEPSLDIAETCHQLLLRKLLTKWLARMGCAYLPPQVASWRYQRGRRSLLENLQKKTSAKPATNDGVAEPEDQLFFVPDPVEDAMGHMIVSLQDKSTIVRWTAAKGVGRLTERLPLVCAHDVLDALLELCKHDDKDNAWHGACLALAELARRGLLLPARLGDVVPVVVRAIQFDVRRGQSSVGAHVRDAACYTYWAFARAYAPSVLKPFIPELSRSIVVASLFDREVNCRRAASAAFQECVGRQGADNFLHGISILTAADYFTLGNRTEAYTTVAFHVAQFTEYRQPILDHLYTRKLFHWDPAIRLLASRSLRHLTPHDPEYIKTEVIPFLLAHSTKQDLFVRHGAVLGLAEVVLALGETVYENKVQLEIADLVAKIEKLRLYRGRGGEIMRSAVCRLIECLSRAKIHLTVKQQVRLLDSVDVNLKHPSEDTQEQANRALGALMYSYFPVGEQGPSNRLQKRVVDKYVEIVNTSDYPAETRGFSMALGVLPQKLLAPSSVVLESVLSCLCRAARFDFRVGDGRDAETRRNALVALSNVCETVGIGSWPASDAPRVGLSNKQLRTVFESLLLGLDDYNSDRRGDVGSWSRIAAMTGLERLALLSVRADIGEHESSGNSVEASLRFDGDLCIRVIGGLLQHLSEKLDAVRGRAGGSLERLLLSSAPLLPFIPQRERLLKALNLNREDAGRTNWSNASVTYRMVMSAAEIDEFFYPVISGIVTSVGGLAESVTKHSEEALMSFLRDPCCTDVDLESRTTRLGKALLLLFKTHQNERRVILPLLKTLEALLSRGYLDVLLEDDVGSAGSLLSCLRAEAANCTDVPRLLGIVEVGLGVLHSRGEQQANMDALAFILELLGHEYPRVRKHSADQLYVRLLADSGFLEDVDTFDAALEFLLAVRWDDDSMSRVEVSALVNKLALLLGVTLPMTNDSSVPQAKPKLLSPRIDEFESYASLVNSIFSLS